MNRLASFCSRGPLGVLLSCLVLSAVAGCGETEETERHEVAVVTDGTEMEGVETDEGWEIDVQRVRFRVRQIEFSVGGEHHDETELSWFRGLSNAVVPEVSAHPNHAAGGQTGGWFGERVELEWEAGELVTHGTGTFLEGDFSGWDLYFWGQRAENHQLDDGLMARLEARAVGSDGEVVEFEADFSYAEGTEIRGGALSATIPNPELTAVALQLRPYDEWSGTSMFDGIDFSEFTGEESRVEIPSDSTAHSRIRHRLTAHEFYGGRVLED